MPKFLWVRNKEYNKTTNKVNHLLSPPPPLLKWASFLFTNKWQTLLINHAPIRDGLFANWKFGFDSHPRLHYLQPSCTLELIPSSFLNKLSPPSQISPPSNGFKINKPPGLLPSDIHAISYPHCGKGGDWRNPSPELFISCSISKRFCLQWKVFVLFNKMRYILLVVALLEACDVTNNGRHLGFYQELETRLKPR